MTTVIEKISELLGPNGWLTGDDTAPYRRDWLDRYGVMPLGVARPSDTDAVAALVKLCAENNIAVVPQGGNTGLCGAAVAHQERAIILSLSRLSRIDAPSKDGSAVTVEAGVVLARLHETLQHHDLAFPMHLGAEGTATIGGLIGTNAGGSQAFRYGCMQDLVLGLEVVLADGSVWNGLRGVQKDNAGYQLRRLFCGSEGTLGIVTRAVLRLYHAPRQRECALLAMTDFDAAVRFGTHMRAEAGEFLSGIEFFSEIGLTLLIKHLPEIRWPLDSRAPVYVLIDLASGSLRVPLREILDEALEWGMGEGLVSDGAIAMSDVQRAAFWRLREEQPEGQRLEGPQLKHDISVPTDAIGTFVQQGAAICESILAGLRINAFGHLADGNIHYNISPPEGAADFSGTQEAISSALSALATDLGGSFAAEHGLGRSKLALARANRGEVERSLMARLRAAFDPSAVLNPGVLVDAAEQSRTFG